MSIQDFMSRHRRTAVTIGAGSAILVGMAALVFHQREPSRPANKAEIEAVVRDYILAHPEILPQAMERLRDRQSQDAYTTNKAAFETPFASAWAGAEKGDVTLVMFTDYACGYCRSSLPDIDRLIAEDSRLKVVWREIPILGPGSEVAAKGALAAAQQGAFRSFHERMFAAGTPSPDKVSAVLQTIKLDPVRIQQDANSPAVTAELHRNIELAQRLDPSIATPTFLINGQVMKGAVGYDALKQAIEAARKRT